MTLYSGLDLQALESSARSDELSLHPGGANGTMDGGTNTRDLRSSSFLEAASFSKCGAE
jgi:hypothetical protein